VCSFVYICFIKEFKLHSISNFRPEQVPVSMCWKRELVRAKVLNFTAYQTFDRNKFRFPMGAEKIKLHSISNFRPEQVLVSMCWKRELVRAKSLNFTADAISDQNKFRFPCAGSVNLFAPKV